jgi:hypothetical protein
VEKEASLIVGTTGQATIAAERASTITAIRATAEGT